MSHRSRNKKKRLGNKKKEKKPDEWQQDGNDKISGVKWVNHVKVVKENALFEKFYTEIVPQGEMSAFLETLKEDLPVVFRTISGSNFSSFVHEDIASHFPGGESVEVNGKLVEPPHRLKYMPEVYQFNISRKDTRSEPKLAHFKKWLVGAAEAGQVVRQEAVSMIPTSLLDVHDGHIVLDMCAAPGSKTTQLLEAIHENGENSSGVVVANELNENRARMLTHRLKSVIGSNLIITNHDARMFPRIHTGIDPETTGGGTPMDFDRILCDVPCTGDGTLRKARDLWNRWSPDMAKGLHQMQLLIAQRGCRLLKEGGRIVYSTCSMNPMEDEAIVAELLRASQGALQLVDCSEYLPLFRRMEGVSDWKVMNKDGEYIDQSHDEAKYYSDSVWPPSKEEAEKFHLERCWRILPHHQNTGGFFCAVLEKVGPLPRAQKKKKVAAPEEQAAEAAAAVASNNNDNNVELMEIEGQDEEQSAEKGKEGEAAGDKDNDKPKGQKKKRVRRSYESPYIMVDPNSENGATVRQGLEYFGLDLDPTKFMVRNDESVGIYFYVGGRGQEILPMDSVGRLHVMSAGMRVFVKHKRTIGDFNFRLASEACSLLASKMTKRVIECPLEDAVKFVGAQSVLFANLSEASQKELAKYEAGSVIFRVNCGKDGTVIPILGWLAVKSAMFQIGKENSEFVRGIVLNAAKAAGIKVEEPEPKAVKGADEGAE